MKKVLTVKENKKNVQLAVVEPSPTQMAEGRKLANVAFRKAISDEALLRDEVQKLLESRGLWSEDTVKEIEALRNDIRDGEAVLAAGGIKLSEGRNVAMKVSEARGKLTQILAEKNRMDSMTAESQAENERFDYLVSQCVVYNKTGKPFFKDLNDYRERSSEPAAVEGAKLFAAINYGYDEDIEKRLPENKFLIQYGYVNDDLKFLNEDKKLVDSEGRLVDEEGRYLDEQGNFVDIHGNRVDQDGNLVVESKPFLDDGGKPVVLESETVK